MPAAVAAVVAPSNVSCPRYTDPANPIRRNILHYLVTNVPAEGMTSEGTQVRGAA